MMGAVADGYTFIFIESWNTTSSENHFSFQVEYRLLCYQVAPLGGGRGGVAPLGGRGGDKLHGPQKRDFDGVSSVVCFSIIKGLG